jgi:hypothetical protein
VRTADFQLIDGHLYKLGADGILRRCMLDHEHSMVLGEADEAIVGGNYARKPTTKKVLRAVLWWTIVHKDAKE